MAYREIETMTGDLRATKNDIGAFLTVDDNCNLIWTNSRVTASGGIWEYNVIEDDSYVILPQAKLNVGLCIAIMRGKTSKPRDSGHGTVPSKANPKIILLPYNANAGTSKEPEYDYIHGGPNVYCSSGISWNFSTKSFDETNMEFDEYSSLILKSVYVGEGKYSWVIINGVGLWNAESLNEEPLMYAEAMKGRTPFNVSVQTSSITSLSAGVSNTDTQFVPIEAINSLGLDVISENGGSAGGSSKLLPQSNVKKTNGEFLSPNSYLIGRFPSETTARNTQFNEFSEANVNVIGVSNGWSSDTTKYTKVNINSLDSAVNWLGYVFDDASSETWWEDNGSKCFSKKLGLRAKGDKTLADYKNTSAVQVVVNVPLSEIVLQNQAEKTSLRTLYAMIQSYIESEISSSSGLINVFKVPGTVFSANDPSLLESDIAILSSSLANANQNQGLGYGSILGIHLTDADVTNGNFNLVFEFFYDAADENGQQFDSLDAFKQFAGDSNEYCLINFIGIEQLKNASISPEVGFEQFAVARLGARGYFDARFSNPTIIADAYIDASAQSDQEHPNYVGIVVGDGSFKEIGNYYSETKTTFFDGVGRYYPADDTTKTVIDYSVGFNDAVELEVDGGLKARLVIDWSNSQWQFNGTMRFQGDEYVCSKNAAFSEQPVDLDFYQKGLVTFRMKEAIQIQHNGLIRLPWFVSESIDNEKEANVTISHYKTVVHQSGAIETLMNYRCGWERAESEWTIKAYTDGTECDGLISDYTGISEGSEVISPSKQCIVPSHAMQRTISPIAFYRSGSLDDASKAPKAILPYLAEENIRYFSTQWSSINGKLNYTDGSNVTESKVAINDFCQLVFTPKSTGTLVCDIEAPIDLGQSSTGYLILKQNLQNGIENSEVYGDYVFVKDSGANINAFQNNGTNTLKIHFTDRVVSQRKIRYTIFIYDAPWTNGTITEKNALIYMAQNSAIARYRPGASKQSLGYAGMNDLKTLFESNGGNYKGAWQFDAGDNAKSMTSIFPNRIFSEPDAYTRDDVDWTDLDFDKFKTLMFNTTGNRINSPKTANLGSTFSFYAYVLKELI